MIVSALIPAAGAASRFGEDKLARQLGGRPVLVRAVEALSKRDEVRDIIVAGPPDDLSAFTARFGDVLGFLGATIVPGGAQARWQTVAAALTHVADDCTHIAVHDAARPCPGEALLDRVFAAAAKLPAVVPGVAVSSAVKRVQVGRVHVVRDDDVVADAILGADSDPGIQAWPVSDSVERAGLMAVQTPQVFHADLLRRAHAEVDPNGAVDDADLVQRLGEPVHVVHGDPMNVKLTHPADWSMAEAALRGGGSVL